MSTASVSSLMMMIAAVVIVVSVVSCVLQHGVADLADSLSEVDAGAGCSAATTAAALFLLPKTVVVPRQPFALPGRYVR